MAGAGRTDELLGECGRLAADNAALTAGNARLARGTGTSILPSESALAPSPARAGAQQGQIILFCGPGAVLSRLLEQAPRPRPGSGWVIGGTPHKGVSRGGRHLAQWLVARGERVDDVASTATARVRELRRPPPQPPIPR